MKRRWFVLGLCLLRLVSLVGQTVRVGLEPFPPLVNEDGTGLTVTMLREIEKVSSLRFTIKVMPYNRAKTELAASSLDLIGHTPYGLETDEFYAYAQEIAWTEELITDFYAMNSSYLQNPERGIVGIPRGNAAFASELTGIPLKNFYEEDLKALVPMLAAGRINSIWFERGSTMSSIAKAGVKAVLYRQFPPGTIPAGLAVARGQSGDQLRAKMEEALKRLDLGKIFSANRSYLKLPSEGIVQN
jgi:polar amino acid transport system substrate-binding protein